MRNPLRARLAHALDRRIHPLDARIDGLADDVAHARRDLSELRSSITRIETALASLDPRLDAVRADAGAAARAAGELERRFDDDVVRLLRTLVLDDEGHRRRLETVRAHPDYGRPYDDPEPLVSICIPTCEGRADLLHERALASALAQTYSNIEIVVVGDGFDPRTDPRIGDLDDPRVRIGTVTQRVGDADPARQWMIGATLPRQEARRMAGGLWITDLDDDDALSPDAVERLLDRARETRAEVASGLILQHLPEGGASSLIAGFPNELVPAWCGLPEDWPGRACTAALWHHGLRVFLRTHAAAALGIPGDLLLAVRMARVGVRFALLDEPVYEYWPGTLWDPLRAPQDA